MVEEIATGTTVTVSYTSDRSGNVVSRKGRVLQTPSGSSKRGLFVQTDDDQLTGVIDERVYSITIETKDGERSVQRKTYLGTLDSVE